MQAFTPLDLNPLVFTNPLDSANVTLDGSDNAEAVANLAVGANPFISASAGERPGYDPVTGLITFDGSQSQETQNAIQLSDCTLVTVRDEVGTTNKPWWRHGDDNNHRGLSRDTTNSFQDVPSIVYAKGGSAQQTGDGTRRGTNLGIFVLDVSANVATVHVDGYFHRAETDSRIENTIIDRFYHCPLVGGERVSANLGETLAFDYVLAAWQRQVIEGWLAHHRGLTSELSTEHPFRAGRPMRVGNNATVAGGGAVDTIRIFDWPTGALLDAFAPEANGDWWRCVPAGMTFGVTYLAAGCQPITHGPYTAPDPA